MQIVCARYFNITLSYALNTTPEYFMGWEKEVTDSSLEFRTIENPEDAMPFILKHPTLMAYGGYDIKKMTNDDIVDFANELLIQLELLSYKYKPLK